MNFEELFRSVAISSVSLVGKAAYSYASSMALKKITTVLVKTDERHLLKLKSKLERHMQFISPILDGFQQREAQGTQNPNLKHCLVFAEEIKEHMEKISDVEVNIGILEELLNLIDELLPLISITLQSLPSVDGSSIKISSSRLLKASTCLTTSKLLQTSQVGPDFPVRLYTLFEGSARKGNVDWTWKEEYTRARCFVERMDDKKYCIRIDQSIDDGRYHEEDEKGESQVVEVRDVSQMYYTTAGSLLNIHESSYPVLSLKVANRVEASSPSSTPQKSRKPNWLAFELYNAEEGSSNMLDLGRLCLLEDLIRLCSLEQREGMDHSQASDQLLGQYFLNASSSKVVKSRDSSPVELRRGRIK